MVGSLHGNACELDESNDDKMDLNYTFAPAREPGEFARQGGNRLGGGMVFGDILIH